MNFDFTKIPSFGVAGNFTGHLEQAGEAKDFANIKTKEATAPKAVFPTYIPAEGISGTAGSFPADADAPAKDDVPAATAGRIQGGADPVPAFLHTFPFGSEKLIFPKNEQKIQVEPECGIVFAAEWNGKTLVNLRPLCFGASNDCTIRREGAKKISEKKNWGSCSKGFSSQLIPIDSFDENGILNRYRIASFLVRGKDVFVYGEDSAVRNYSYIYSKLGNWLIEKFNSQKDEGPAEDIHSYLVSCGCPDKIMVSIGATRYTEYGEHNFLNKGDESVIIMYPEDKYSHEQIKEMVQARALCGNDAQDDGISVLWQTVLL